MSHKFSKKKENYIYNCNVFCSTHVSHIKHLLSRQLWFNGKLQLASRFHCENNLYFSWWVHWTWPTPISEANVVLHNQISFSKKIDNKCIVFLVSSLDLGNTHFWGQCCPPAMAALYNGLVFFPCINIRPQSQITRIVKTKLILWGLIKGKKWPNMALKWPKNTLTLYFLPKRPNLGGDWIIEKGLRRENRLCTLACYAGLIWRYQIC